LSEFSLSELRTYSDLFDEAAVGLTPELVVAARDLPGGTARTQVALQAQAARQRLVALGDWAFARRANLPTLDILLRVP
jgi:hypothetical protein